jgi:hypothetical protein
LAVLLSAFAGGVQAQVVVVPSTPQLIQSCNGCAVSHPPDYHAMRRTAISKSRIRGLQSENLKLHPSGCLPRPVGEGRVFTADFKVTAGRQYDRTASFYLGHANIYYGTTAEPRASLSPSWHVERDVTDLSAIFQTDQTGQADLGNFVGVYGGGHL